MLSPWNNPSGSPSQVFLGGSVQSSRWPICLRHSANQFFCICILAVFGWALFVPLHMNAAAAGPFEDQVDKAAHFGLSSVMVQTSMRGFALVSNDPHITSTNRICSSILTLSVGVAKEVYDRSRGGEFSYPDLAADGLGVVTGNLLFWEF